MDKFTLTEMLKKSKPVERVSFIQEKCLDKRVLDLGCIRHSADYALKDQNWLHKKIKLVANELIGIDYLSGEVEKLNAAGYHIIARDATKPLNIKGKFDVIVAGDLIEHLVNFEGFFENCQRLLKDGGIIIISTPNPFYAELFHFLSFKHNFLINPEHTCWIDPQALLQLTERFGYLISEIHYIKESFKIKNLILETSNHRYDILSEKWTPESLKKKIKRKIFGIFFQVFYVPFKIIIRSNTILVKYSDYLAVLVKKNNENHAACSIARII